MLAKPETACPLRCQQSQTPQLLLLVGPLLLLAWLELLPTAELLVLELLGRALEEGGGREESGGAADVPEAPALELLVAAAEDPGAADVLACEDARLELLTGADVEEAGGVEVAGTEVPAFPLLDDGRLVFPVEVPEATALVPEKPPLLLPDALLEAESDEL